MSVPRFSRSEDSQVDPFNAPDPVMPGSDPEPLDRGMPDDSPANEGDVSYAPHGETDGVPHKPEDDYQAPTTRGGDYDAPSTDEPPQPAEAPAPRRTRTPRPQGERRASAGRRLGCGCVVAIAGVLFALGALIYGVVEMASDSLSDSSSGHETSYEADYGWGDEQDAAIAQALGARLDEVLATPESGPLHDALASYLDETLLDREGYTAAELGIDADAWATWLLSAATFVDDEVYDFGDGTAAAYVTLSGYDAYSVISDGRDAIFDYLIDHDLGIWGADEPAPLTDDERAAVGALWDEAMADTRVTELGSCRIEVTLVDGAWVPDEADLQENLTYDLGVY